MTKLQTLAEIEGFDDKQELIEEYVIESVVPGICRNDNCDYTADVEPDSRDGSP